MDSLDRCHLQPSAGLAEILEGLQSVMERQSLKEAHARARLRHRAGRIRSDALRQTDQSDGGPLGPGCQGWVEKECRGFRVQMLSDKSPCEHQSAYT